METVLYLFIHNNRTFVAKCVEKKFIDVVEFNPVMTNQGLQLVGVLIGAVDELKNDIISFILDKNSPYYQTYFSVTSNIQPASNRKIIH